MKKILSLIVGCFLASLTIQAQTPQAVCYQAAAKNDQGLDLIGQDIAVRAAIVKDNPNGTVEWEEIHSPTTDQFGLFTLNIGEGNPTGNGAQANFADVDWGNGTYWLRIEMDATGGMDFELMGATQIISVPYALYAEGAASADFAETANTADSALTAQTALTAETALDDGDKDETNELQDLTLSDDCILSISGGNEVDLKAGIFAPAGASADFPQGIIGEPMVLLDDVYTVPDGKNLYLTASGPTMLIKTIGGDFDHPTSPNMPVLPPGTQIENCYCTATLIDVRPEIEAVVIDLNDPAGYTVPAGKTFFVKSGIPNSLPGMLTINGFEMEFFRPNLTRGSKIVTLPENVNIKKPALYSELVLTGYLVSN